MKILIADDHVLFREGLRQLLLQLSDEVTVIEAADHEGVLRLAVGRWKLIILFHLFGGKVLRFSDLERAIPAISQKMLVQQLRQLEKHAVVRRIVHHQVPPKVEYGLTDWGQALCPALDALLTWFEQHEAQPAPEDGGSRTI